MNFTQPFPAPAAPLPYQLRVNLEEFVRQMGEVFDRSVQEEKSDESFHKLGDWPALDRLQELGYPSLAELVRNHPKVLEKLIHGLVPGPVCPNTY
jgi:hypothetical protein